MWFSETRRIASSRRTAGKTTTAIVLMAELAQGTDVALADADPAERFARWSKASELPPQADVIASNGERMVRNEIAVARSLRIDQS